MNLSKVRLILTDGEEEYEVCDTDRLMEHVSPSLARTARGIGTDVATGLAVLTQREIKKLTTVVVEVFHVESFEDMLRMMGAQTRPHPKDRR